MSEIPQKGVEHKRGEGKPRFQKKGKLDQGLGALKRGMGTSLRTMHELLNSGVFGTWYLEHCYI